MEIDVARLFTWEKLRDQLLGLGFGVGVAVLTVVVGEASQASDAEIVDAAFWYAVVVTAVRSAFTAVGTVLGLNIPGVSSR